MSEIEEKKKKWLLATKQRGDAFSIKYFVDCELKTTIYVCNNFRCFRYLLGFLKKQEYRVYSFDGGHFWLYNQQFDWKIVLKLKEFKE